MECVQLKIKYMECVQNIEKERTQRTRGIFTFASNNI